MSIFVIGMHRSGTSMVAGMLKHLGVHFGDERDMLPANSANELGYFEHQRVLALNDALARANKVSWRTLPSLDVSSHLAGQDDYVAGVKDLADELNRHAPWGIKDPRLSFFLPFWRARAGKAHVVVCIRKPDAVARSLSRRNGLSPAYGAALWELYTLAALKNSEKLHHTIVNYEDCILDPGGVVSNLVAKVEEWEGIKPNSAQIQAALRQVRPELDHADDDATNDEAPDADKLALYERIVSGQFEAAATNVASSKEIIRLEQSHQNAKTAIDTLRGELAHQSAALDKERRTIEAVQERLADLLGWARLSQTSPAASGDAQRPSGLDEQLEALKQVIHLATQVAALKPLAEQARAELIASKDERIAWREAELRRLTDRLAESEQRYEAIFVDMMALRARAETATQLKAQTEALQRDLADHAERTQAAKSEAARTRNLLDDARREFGSLRAELEAAEHRAREDKRRANKADEEVLALRQALQAARTLPPAPPPTGLPKRAEAAPAAPPNEDKAARRAMRRRFKAMHDIIKSMDQALSPPLGRIAVPVRQLRGDLVRLRAIVVSELEKSRENDPLNEQ